MERPERLAGGPSDRNDADRKYTSGHGHQDVPSAQGEIPKSGHYDHHG